MKFAKKSVGYKALVSLLLTLAIAAGYGCIVTQYDQNLPEVEQTAPVSAGEQPAANAPAAPSDVYAAASACPRAVVTSGLGLAWEKLNHRISLWRIYPDQAACPNAVPQNVPLQAGYVGGNWSTGQTASDTPLLRYRYFAVDAPEAVEFYALSVELFLDAPEDEAEKEVVLNLGEVGLAGKAAYTVLLSGLELRTDVKQVDPAYPPEYEPAMGYTSRGIGAAVRNLTIEEDVARFNVWARFELGKADRPRMNQAIEHARTRAVVHVLVAGLSAGAVTTAKHEYYLIYDPPWLMFQKPYNHTGPVQRHLEIQGEPGYPVAFCGLRSFDFRLFGSVKKGDYLRELSVQARLLSYDRAGGKAVLDVDGYASNASLLTYETMENKFTAELALVQLPSGSAEPGDLRQPFATGEATLNLN